MSDEIQSTPPISKRKKFAKKLVGFLLFLLVITLAAASGYFYWQYQKLSKSPLAGQIQAEEENNRAVKAVGKLMLLPTDETPVVATIADIDKLKDVPFYKNAKNGQKLIIYSNLKQAILYDPTTNMIINVGSFNMTEDQKQGAQ